MSIGPKFPGDLSDHLPVRPERPDCWRDRLRHAWLLYLVLTTAVVIWVGLMVLTVVYLGSFGWLLAMMIAGLPFAIYYRLVFFFAMFGRDPETGEWGRRRDN